MSLINDDDIYPVTMMLGGATMIGSMPDGKTVQFSIEGIMDFIMRRLDFIHYQNATRIGQTIMGNDPDDLSTHIETINDGGQFLGTINFFPPTTNAHINFITRIIPR